MNSQTIAKTYQESSKRFNINFEKEEPVFSISIGNYWRDFTTSPDHLLNTVEQHTQNFNSLPFNLYMATGTFKKGSIRLENGKNVGRNARNLERVLKIPLDADYISYILYLSNKKIENRNPKDKKTIEEYEPKLRNLSNERLNEHLNIHLALIKNVLDKAKIPYSKIVKSGYGHYVKIFIRFEDQGRIEEIREFHKALVSYLNKIAGYDLFDPQCTDAGTRVVRIEGSCNLKNPEIPRLVSSVEDNGKFYDLDGLIELVPKKERDADRPEHTKSFEGDFPRKEITDICRPYYYETNRNNFAFHGSAYVFKNGGSLEDALAIVEALAIEHEDEEIQNRLTVVKNTFKKFQAGDKIKSYYWIYLSYIIELQFYFRHKNLDLSLA